jgi:hypothetical protein
MAHTYMIFDFGADEDKAQQAHHKLQGWKQAFRLDKKLQFKFDRISADATADAKDGEETATEPTKSKGKDKKKGDEKEPGENGHVKLLVRLYFSPHEKLSEQRWFDRIPAEEPFSEASPALIREGETDFAGTLSHFESLE